jgi:opacity protein-like surface antigen
MKKAIIVSLLVALGSTLFALEFSFGGGLLTGATFNTMETTRTNVPALTPTLPPGANPNLAMEYTVTDFDIGAFVFADIKYAELSIGFLQQIGNVTDINASIADGAMEVPQDDESYLSSLLLIEVLGKYPFTLNEKISIYPALGVMFRIPFAGNDYSDFEHNASWGLGIKAGGGLDFNLTEALFLRCELLVYYELTADKEISASVAEPYPPMSLPPIDLDFDVKDAGYYVQPQLKIAIGYRL